MISPRWAGDSARYGHKVSGPNRIRFKAVCEEIRQLIPPEKGVSDLASSRSLLSVHYIHEFIGSR